MSKYLLWISLFVTIAVTASCSSGPKRVALTFDDGPHAEYTLALLDVLKEEQVTATFFMVGENIEKNPAVAQAVFDAGHVVGNHSYDHAKASLITYDYFKDSIEKTDKLIEGITGNATPMFRAPYLNIAASNEQYLCETGRRSVGVTTGGNDWENQDPNFIFDTVMEQVDDGEVIILLHDDGQIEPRNRMGSVAAAHMLIKHLRSEGYEFVTLDKIDVKPHLAPAC